MEKKPTDPRLDAITALAPWAKAILGRRRTIARDHPIERVTVIGGGIVGLSIAHCLARSGARVVVVEKGRPGGAATARSFAWINATHSKRPRAYCELNRLGIASWRALQAEMPELEVRWGGSVEWAEKSIPAEALAADVARHRSWGYPLDLLAPEELARLEPEVVLGSPRFACHGVEEGHVDPEHATTVLVSACESFGVEVRTASEVTEITHHRLDRFGVRCEITREGDPDHLESAQEYLESDAVVLACGAGTARVAALAGVDAPTIDSPGLLVHFAANEDRLRHVVLAPDVHMRQTGRSPSHGGGGIGNGGIVAGRDFGGRLDDTSIDSAVEQIVRAAGRRLPALEGVAPVRWSVGFRPMPRDEYPILGRAPGAPAVYLAVMHSGVTLAPLVGRLVAAELLDNCTLGILDPYRPERFA